MKPNGKHELDRLAAKFAAKRAESLILQPDASNENNQQAFQAEYQPVSQLREAAVFAALDGGAPVTIDTLNACEALAKELVRRRCEEALKIAVITKGKAGPAFRFVCEAVGIDVDAELGPSPTQPAANEAVVNLHG